MEQMQREIDQLKLELARQKGSITGGLQPNQVQILQPIADVPARAASGSDWSMQYKRAKIWDLRVAALVATGGTLTAKLVTDGTTPRYGLLVNPWTEIIAQDAYVLAAPYKGVYLPISEQCGT